MPKVPEVKAGNSTLRGRQPSYSRTKCTSGISSVRRSLTNPRRRRGAGAEVMVELNAALQREAALSLPSLAIPVA